MRLCVNNQTAFGGMLQHLVEVAIYQLCRDHICIEKAGLNSEAFQQKDPQQQCCIHSLSKAICAADRLMITIPVVFL